MTTQPEKALALLNTGPKSTLDLRANFIMNAAGAILWLRRHGHNIRRTSLPNRVALYTLVKADK